MQSSSIVIVQETVYASLLYLGSVSFTSFVLNATYRICGSLLSETYECRRRHFAQIIGRHLTYSRKRRQCFNGDARKSQKGEKYIVLTHDRIRRDLFSTGRCCVRGYCHHTLLIRKAYAVPSFSDGTTSALQLQLHRVHTLVIFGFSKVLNTGTI